MEVLVRGHPRDAKKVPVTGAARLRQCKNTEFVLELRKTGLTVCRTVRSTGECPFGKLSLYFGFFLLPVSYDLFSTACLGFVCFRAGSMYFSF